MLSFVSGKSKVHIGDSEIDQPASAFSTPSRKKPDPQSSASDMMTPLVTQEKSGKSFIDEDVPDDLALLLSVTDGEGATPMKEATVGQLFVEQPAKESMCEAKHENDTGGVVRADSAGRISIDVNLACDPVEEAMPSIPRDPSPMKRQLSTTSGESPVNSTSSTPFAKVLPAKSSAALQPPSPKNVVQSVKLTKQRSKSMLGSGNSFRGSFPSDKDNEPAPSMFSLDRKLSPSEKFRSFMKSFAAPRSVSLDGVDEQDGPGIDVPAPLHISGGSHKVGSSGSSRKTMAGDQDKMWNKDLKARIAKVQEEQWKFRQSQKLKTISGKGSFKTTESTKEKDRINKKLKMNKNGVAPIYNTYSIRAGLRKCEFRETLEAGATVIKKAPSLASESTESTKDTFNVYSMPQFHAHNEHLHPHHENIEPRSVTMHGEGYMDEADWKITSTEIKKKMLNKTLNKIAPADKGDDLNSSSNLNLEQVIEAALKEQSALSVNNSDCADVNLVPLCYLQSANLIEKRFGWESRDHTIKQEAPSRQKSWLTLRAAVQFSGAFNMIAAAAAATPHSGVGDHAAHSPVKPAPEPAPNAPVIVVEATPVTDFVAGLVQQSLRHASGSFDSSASPSSSPERGVSLSPERKRPSFVISKEVPQRPGSPEKSITPSPLKQIIHKDDAKTAKLKATAKDLHDHYSGLLWRDTSRNLIWQGTEEIILGTQRAHTNTILNTRSDMRWAGKTLNMFRPWSAARQEDVIDQFRHQQPMSTRPGSPNSPGRNSGRNSPVFSFSGADSFGGESAKGTNSRGNSRGSQKGGASGFGASNGGGSVTGGSITGGSVTGGSITGGSVSSNNSNARVSFTGKKSSAHSGSASNSVTGSHGHAHGSVAVGDAIVSKNGLVTFGMHRVDQSDNASVLTANTNIYGSRSSLASKRAPLLINLVKPQATM